MMMRDFLRRIFCLSTGCPGRMPVADSGGPRARLGVVFLSLALRRAGPPERIMEGTLLVCFPSYSGRTGFSLPRWSLEVYGYDDWNQTGRGVKSDIGIGRQVRLRRDLTSRIHRSRPFSAPLFWLRPGSG
jgi:hypothetical protein